MTGRMRPACSVIAAAAPVDVEVACADIVDPADPVPEEPVPVAPGVVATGVLVPDAVALPLADPLLLPGATTIPPSGPFEEGLLTVADFDASTNAWRLSPELGGLITPTIPALQCD